MRRNILSLSSMNWEEERGKERERERERGKEKDNESIEELLMDNHSHGLLCIR